MKLRPELAELLAGFEKRMKFINIARSLIEYSYRDNIREMIPDRDLLDNIIVAVLVFIKERTLGREQNCSLEDIADFLDNLAVILPNEITINSAELARFIVVDVLQKGGVLTNYEVYISGNENFELVPVRLIEEERGTYHLTDDAFDFLFRSKEIESELDYSVTRFRMAEYMKRDNYAEALDQSRELVSKIRNMKVSMDDFMRRCRENIAKISIDQYETVVSRVRNLLETEYEELRIIQDNAKERANSLTQAQQSGVGMEDIQKHRKALNEIIHNIQLTIEEQRSLINKKMSLSDAYQSILSDSYAMNRYERLNFDKDIMAEMRNGNIPLDIAALYLLFPLTKPEFENRFSVENFYALQTKITELEEDDVEDINSETEEENPIEVRNKRFLEICKSFFDYLITKTEFRISEFVASLNDEKLYEFCEEKLYRDYEISMRKLRELTDDQKKKADKKGSLDIQLHDATERLSELEAANQKLQDGLSTVDHAPEAEIIPGDWTALLAEYSKLLEVQSADLKRLNDERTRLQKEKDEKQKEIQKRNCEQEEYDILIYSEDLEMEASNDLNVAESEYQSADVVYNSMYRSQGKAEASLENAAKGLDDFGGEALPLNEIGKSFDSRISEAGSAISGIDSELKYIDKILSQLQKVQGKAETAIENYPRPTRYTGIILDKDYSAQLSRLTGQIRDWNRSISTHKNSVEDNLKSMASAYGSKSTDVSLAILSMQDLLSNAVVRGDRYYTLCEHIDANMHTAQLRISQIDTDLKEFNKTKGDLIHQCVIQGRQMYEGLMQLSANSRVKVQDKRRQMIRFDIPDSVDENTANASIAAEIEKGATEIAIKILDDSYAESEIRKIAGRIVGSKRLLRKYINQENIVLKAYKIDRNPDNSGYRTWEQTQVNNSGAEKFVVYFAVILALMAYARDGQDELGGKNIQSVLILDNPFGPISSKHVLEPMFEISRNYKVQMICLSDISKSDIVSCFDLVIRAIVKQLSFGSKEQLTHDGNESIEHGFYRSEQINLWQAQ